MKYHTELHFSVPSSILLCGEYYITEDNAEAICLGIEPRARLCICMQAEQKPATLQFVESFANKKTILSAKESRFWTIVQSFASDVYQGLKPHVCSSYVPKTFSQQFRSGKLDRSVTICIDSSAQYDAKTGKKRGLGSSASCAVLISAAHMLLSGFDPLQDHTVLEILASKLHFRWQGMKGSSYDVYASVYGNCLFLKRNKKQEAVFSKQRIKFPSELRWLHWNSGKSISSRDALNLYQIWKKENKEAYNEHFSKLYTAIQKYFQCTSEHEYHDWLSSLNILGKKLGDYIGLSAVIEAEDSVLAWKACGAGNEQGIGIAKKNASIRDSRILHEICISEGIRQEELKSCNCK